MKAARQPGWLRLIRATMLRRYTAFGRECRLIPARYFEQLALLRAKADAPSLGDGFAVKALAENKAVRRGADRIGLGIHGPPTIEPVGPFLAASVWSHHR